MDRRHALAAGVTVPDRTHRAALFADLSTADVDITFSRVEIDGSIAAGAAVKAVRTKAAGQSVAAGAAIQAVIALVTTEYVIAA